MFRKKQAMKNIDTSPINSQQESPDNDVKIIYECLDAILECKDLEDSDDGWDATNFSSNDSDKE